MFLLSKCGLTGQRRRFHGKQDLYGAPVEDGDEAGTSAQSTDTMAAGSPPVPASSDSSTVAGSRSEGADDNRGDNESLGLGAIVGIAVGAAVLLAIMLYAAVAYGQRAARRKFMSERGQVSMKL